MRKSQTIFFQSYFLSQREIKIHDKNKWSPKWSKTDEKELLFHLAVVLATLARTTATVCVSLSSREQIGHLEKDRW